MLRNNRISQGHLARRTLPNLPDLAYMFGVYIGDGNVVREGQGRRNYFRLKVKSVQFAIAVSQALIGLIGYARMKRNKEGYFEVRAYSRTLVDRLARWRTEPIVKNHPDHFIRGFYESEGSILTSKKGQRTIRMVNTDEHKMHLVARCLTMLKFRFTISRYHDKRPTNRKPILCLFLLGGHAEVRRFLNTMNPCIKGWN